jgi:hypothetical protein
MHNDCKEARYNNMSAKFKLTSKYAKYGKEEESRIETRTLVRERDFTPAELNARLDQQSNELYGQDAAAFKNEE